MSKASPEVMGVRLEDLDDPIQVALQTYVEHADERIAFGDIAAASQLVITPTKPNSARASTSVSFRGEEVATLWVIAFARGDATGDETHGHSLNDLTIVGRPQLPRFVPRNKRGVPGEADIESEVHLTLLSQNASASNAPRLFAGHLRMLGITDETQVTDIGYVGQDRDTFREVMRGARRGSPTATLTTGRTDMLHIPNDANWGEVFGSPHAIAYDDSICGNGLQVCGFVGLTSAVKARMQADIALCFGAEEPELTTTAQEAVLG